jgi:two-component system phosphate regulon sensor histidine kinase PhoR
VRYWIVSLARVLFTVALLLVPGVLLGRPLLVVAVGISAYLSWHLVQLATITRWLQRAELEEAPDPPGMWGELSAQLRGFIFRDRKRERRFNTMLREYQESTAAMPDASVVLNDSHEILWFNAAAERLLDLDATRDIGLRIDNLIRRSEFSSYLTSEHERERDPLEIPAPANKKVKLVVYIVPFGAGRRLVLFRDNTRLHQLEKVRRKFVANASHELRSPLTVISGYLEQMAEDGAVMQDWDGPMGEMLRQSDRMQAIINDLLELSRLESASQDASMERVDVRQLLSDVVAEARSQVEQAPEIDRVIGADMDILGAERELHSVCANLVINAVKYTPVGGRIMVRWECDRRGGHLSVEDTGIGIAREHLQRLTERFYRVDKGRARGAGGTGLGLAIVKHALQRHGATLDIQSELGKGSRFTCHFPPERVVAAGASEFEVEAIAATAAVGPGLTVEP